MSAHRAKYNKPIKVVAVLVMCTFLCNNLAAAGDYARPIPPHKATLSPGLFLKKGEQQDLLHAMFVYKTIEKRARTSSGKIHLADIKKWAALGASRKELEDVTLLDYGPEIHVLVDEEFLIRYFNLP